MTLKEIVEKYQDGKYRRQDWIDIGFFITNHQGIFLSPQAATFCLSADCIFGNDWELFEEPKACGAIVPTETNFELSEIIGEKSVLIARLKLKIGELEKENEQLRKSQWQKWPEEKPTDFASCLVRMEYGSPIVAMWNNESFFVSINGISLNVRSNPISHWMKIPEVENE